METPSKKPEISSMTCEEEEEMQHDIYQNYKANYNKFHSH